MEEKKLMFIYNPKSGKGLIRNYIYEIVDLFTKYGYEVSVYPTQRQEDAMQRVPEIAPLYDLLVASGGDGTLDECVTGMMRSEVKIPIGYIPAGSTNDFAQSIHIPKNMMRAAEIAMTGKQFPCDVGVFNRDYFIYVAAFGLFSDVSYQTNQNMKNVLGHVAYLLEGAKRLYDIPSYPLKVKVNGETIEDEFVYGMITNSISVGGMKNMVGKDVRLDDGLFEVTLIKMPANILELNDILQYVSHLTDTSDMVYRFKTSHLVLESDEPVNWTRDGEYGGVFKRVEIDNLHRAMKIIAPGEFNMAGVPDTP